MSEITINFAADPSAALQGIKQLDTGFQTIEEGLDAVAKAGGKLSDDLIKEFLDSERAAKKTAGEVEKVLVDSYDVPADAAKRMAKIAKGELEDVGDKAEDVADQTKKIEGAANDVGTALGDLGGVAKDALEGDVAGAAGGALDALSGMAAAIPGIGAVAGVALAEIGKGFVDMWNERAQESEQRISDMYDAMIESGNAYLPKQYLMLEVSRLLSKEEGNRYDEIKSKAEALNLPIETVAAAYAGWGEAIAEVQSAADNAIDSENERQGKANYQVSELERIAREAKGALEGVSAATDTASERAEAAINTTTRYGDAWESASSRAMTAEQARWDALGAAHAAASALPPVEVKTTVQEPNIGSIFDRAQALANNRTIVFRARTVNSRGEDVD